MISLGCKIMWVGSLALTIAALTACFSDNRRLTVQIEQNEEHLQIILENNSPRTIVFHDRFLDLGQTGPPRLDLVLRSETGGPLRQCRAVLYDFDPKVVQIGPGQKATVWIHLGHIKNSYCAKADVPYLAQVTVMNSTGVPDQNAEPSNVLRVVFQDFRNSKR